MRAWVLMLAVMTTACAKPGGAPPEVMAERAAALTLAELAEVCFVGTLSFDERMLVEAAAVDPRPEIAALAVATLYRDNPERWADALFAHWSVNDHASRAAGASVFVTPKDTRAALLEIRTTRSPNEHHMISTLIAFQDWRTRDAWVVNMDESVSVARAFRVSILDTLWADPIDRGKLSLVDVLDQLDARARAEFEDQAD